MNRDTKVLTGRPERFPIRIAEMFQAMAKGGVNWCVLLEELVIADAARLSQLDEAAKALMRAARNLAHRRLDSAEVRNNHQRYVAITRFAPFPDGVVVGLHTCQ